MPKFAFNWSLIGSTIIEASSFDEAQEQFAKTPVRLLVDAASRLTRTIEEFEVGVLDFEDNFRASSEESLRRAFPSRTEDSK